MINYIRFNNFYSFLDEAEISFKVGKQPAKSLYDINLKTKNNENIRLNKVIATLGANGSGKTQLLKVLPFISWFISQSAKVLEEDDEIFFNAFQAEEEKANTNFEIGFFLEDSNGIFDEYKYKLTLNRKQVYFEGLYIKTSRSFSYIFERNLEKGTYKQRNFLKNKDASEIRPNVSAISYGNMRQHPVAMKIANFFRNFKFNVHSQGRVSSSDLDLIKFSEIIYKNESLKNQVVDLLCKFDTGISDIEFEEITILNNNNEEKKQVNMAVGVHKYKDKDMKFIFLDESNGTRSALLLMGEILPVLNNGGVAIIDELDNDLHPHLLPILLDLFKHKHSNPYDAQIIFSCHTPEVLNLLYKHQIYMVQKNNQESESWRLDQVIGLRVDDNIYSKYMSGALDAVPNV